MDFEEKQPAPVPRALLYDPPGFLPLLPFLGAIFSSNRLSTVHRASHYGVPAPRLFEWLHTHIHDMQACLFWVDEFVRRVPRRRRSLVLAAGGAELHTRFIVFIFNFVCL